MKRRVCREKRRRVCRKMTRTRRWCREGESREMRRLVWWYCYTPGVNIARRRYRSGSRGRGVERT